MYCVQCGTEVGARDRFCAKCGAAQPVSPSSGTYQSVFPGNISAQNWALLCYVPLLGWIAAVIVLASQTFRRDARVRFHAFQGLYLFAAWMLVEWVVGPMFFTQGFSNLAAALLKLLILGSQIFMMVRVNRGEDYRLPLIGELADRSVAEQRI